MSNLKQTKPKENIKEKILWLDHQITWTKRQLAILDDSQSKIHKLWLSYAIPRVEELRFDLAIL